MTSIGHGTRTTPPHRHRSPRNPTRGDVTPLRRRLDERSAHVLRRLVDAIADQIDIDTRTSRSSTDLTRHGRSPGPLSN
jgi:hypothetical protein